MTEYFRALLFASLTVIFTTTAYAGGAASAEGASFNSSENMLYIPAVKVNDRYVANARLKLDTNGQFIIEDFIELSDDEHTLLEKIESLHCGPVDILGRLAARNAFVNGDESYCLVKGPFIFEGTTLHYLLIENGTVQFVSDNRKDLFGTCCFFAESDFTQVKFGFVQDGVFIEQTAADQIDFDREYILQLTSDNVVEF